MHNITFRAQTGPPNQAITSNQKESEISVWMVESCVGILKFVE